MVKDNAKVWGLNNWKDKTATDRDSEGGEDTSLK